MLWNSHLNEVQVSAGYERSKSDTSFYVQKRTVAGRDVFAACAVFIDDIVVTGDDTEKLDELKDLFIEKVQGRHTPVGAYQFVPWDGHHICQWQAYYERQGEN